MKIPCVQRREPCLQPHQMGKIWKDSRLYRFKKRWMLFYQLVGYRLLSFFSKDPIDQKGYRVFCDRGRKTSSGAGWLFGLELLRSLSGWLDYRLAAHQDSSSKKLSSEQKQSVPLS
eukprot:5830261-Amphidinium_carterae.1